MIDSRADILSYFLLAPLLLSILVDAANETRLCDPSKLDVQCGENERCVQQHRTGEQSYCECQITYERVNGRCTQELTTVAVNTTTVRSDPSSDSGGSSVAAGLLIPTFLVVVGVLLYFGARRYKLLQRFRQYRQNRYGNVLVTRDDDDDDDPPISP